MFNINVAQVGSVNVTTSENGGLSDEQIAELVLDKICMISNTAPEPIRQQAFAYKEKIRKILIDYVALAKKEERASIVNILEKNGGNDLANLIRRL
jgi:hypothetical protein|tara:strand:+ start:2331 stop:2618 length:288 start_codon:yes stop_codon:yes gene_type:complete